MLETPLGYNGAVYRFDVNTAPVRPLQQTLSMFSLAHNGPIQSVPYSILTYIIYLYLYILYIKINLSQMLPHLIFIVSKTSANMRKKITLQNTIN